MRGKSPDPSSKWYTEPLRKIRNIVGIVVVVAGGAVAVGNEVLGVAPANVRSAISTVIGIATFVSVVAVAIQAKLGRDGVPGTNFNGMDSPRTSHRAQVASASAASTSSPPPSEQIRALGDELGMTIDGKVKRAPRARRR